MGCGRSRHHRRSSCRDQYLPSPPSCSEKEGSSKWNNCYRRPNFPQLPPAYTPTAPGFPPPYTGSYQYCKPWSPSQMSPLREEVVKAAKDFVQFLNRSVTPFHAVQECKRMLSSAGFVELPEHGSWTIEANKRYYITKNRSAIFAFAVGGRFVPGNGFSIVVGHTDSPCLRVKPISKLDKSFFNQVGVSTYGGGVWRTWFDRDLSIAGEVVYKTSEGQLARKLINVEQPVLFIPNLAIHLETERDVFRCNTEDHLRPLLETQAAAGLVGDIAKGKEEKTEARDPTDITAEHHQHFLKMIAQAAGIGPEQLVDLDLYLYDTQPAAVVGLQQEFISGARLDNLVGTYTAVRGLIDSLDDGQLGQDGHIRIAACYDNEEVGSGSAQGAESAWTEHMLRRLSCGGDQGAFEMAVGRSMLISADQAHAWHPNYSAKHEENHRPTFHGGVVIKINHNQKYATTSTTHAVLKAVAREANVPLQKVVVRNDSPCGSTVGPILAQKLGLITVDVGCPQLAMHSIREFGDTSSIFQATTLYKTFHRAMPGTLAALL